MKVTVVVQEGVVTGVFSDHDFELTIIDHDNKEKTLEIEQEQAILDDQILRGTMTEVVEFPN